MSNVFSTTREALRKRVLRFGIQAVCGSSDFVATSIGADIPLISSGLRFGWIRTLDAVGVKSFVARSTLGRDFVCHVGDLAEFPFYHRHAFEKELTLCAEWLAQQDKPIIYDIGANVGHISTQLAQMLAPQSPQIYAFEPAPGTFKKLEESVRRLDLSEGVHCINAAASDRPQKLRLSCPKKNSLVAEVLIGVSGSRRDADGVEIVAVEGVSLDDFSLARGLKPTFMKMDVEGSEIGALRGAARLLAADDRPAIVFEFNQAGFAQWNADADTLKQLLDGYAFHYVDDLRGQLRPFGSPIADFKPIDWICNIFCVPPGESAQSRWRTALSRAEQRLARLRG